MKTQKQLTEDASVDNLFLTASSWKRIARWIKMHFDNMPALTKELQYYAGCIPVVVQIWDGIVYIWSRHLVVSAGA